MEIRIEKSSMIPNQWVYLIASLTTVDPDTVEFIQFDVSQQNVTMIGTIKTEITTK
jgi:hypothetical protein